MIVAFATDRKMLAALHVAAREVVRHWTGSEPKIWVISEDLTESDILCLKATLAGLRRPFRVELKIVKHSRFWGYRELSGSLSPYFRLILPELADEERVLYLDCDTFCTADLSALQSLDLEGHIVGMCGEAPLTKCADRRLVEELRPNSTETYYNSGVLLIDVERWRSICGTRGCLEYIERARPDYHDQTALNYVMRGRVLELDRRFNLQTGLRHNWPMLRAEGQWLGSVLHFSDVPKPWYPGGRWLHPFGRLWWRAQVSTAYRWRNLPITRWDSRMGKRYYQAVRDKTLMAGYRRGWWMPKGVEQC